MSQKDIALKDIDKDFKAYADLMMKQLNELETLVQSESVTVLNKEVERLRLLRNKWISLK